MAKHTYEPSLDSCAITIHPKLELKYKILVMTKYEKSAAKAIEALCEEAVKGVRLTKKELDAIQAEMKSAYDKRMANRVRIAAENSGLSEEAFRRKKGI